MLKRACHRFRESFEPGARPPHRGSCPACEAFAGALETASLAGTALPLPASLGRRLRAIPRGSLDEAPPVVVNVPLLPLPAGLAERLRAVGRRGAPPAWARTPWRSLAASLLLALALHAVAGDPVARAQPLAATLGEEVNAALAGTADAGEDLQQGWIAPVLDGAGRRLAAAPGAVAAWTDSIERRIHRLLGSEEAYDQ